MEVLVQSQTYRTFGGSAIFSFAGDLLMIGLGDYGSAVQSIDITAYLRSPTRNPLPTLEGLFDQYHGYLKRLPAITFRRKLQKVDLRFLSGHFNAADNEGWHPSVEKSYTAAGEVAEALQLLKKRIKPDDDFDLDRFLADAREILSQKVNSLDEWEAIGAKASRKRQSLYASKDPWELLEIDWSQYHPRARQVLDAPFFWECADDLAPHGNDTGSDLLEDFRKWNRRYGEQSPLKFLERLLAEWDIEPIDWSVTDQRDVRRLARDEPIALSVCNQAAIGLAFAALKMRATCPAEVLQMGLNALQRTALCVRDSDLSADVKTAWDGAIAQMRSKLESFHQ